MHNNWRITTNDSDLPQEFLRNLLDDVWCCKSLAYTYTHTRLSSNRHPLHFGLLGCQAPDTRTKQKIDVLAFYYFRENDNREIRTQASI